MYAQADMCLTDGSSPKRMSAYLYRRSSVSISSVWCLLHVGIPDSTLLSPSTGRCLPNILMNSPERSPDRHSSCLTMHPSIVRERWQRRWKSGNREVSIYSIFRRIVPISTLPRQSGECSRPNGFVQNTTAAGRFSTRLLVRF